jgi:hypothetical protein
VLADRFPLTMPLPAGFRNGARHQILGAEDLLNQLVHADTEALRDAPEDPLFPSAWRPRQESNLRPSA